MSASAPLPAYNARMQANAQMSLGLDGSPAEHAEVPTATPGAAPKTALKTAVKKVAKPAPLAAGLAPASAPVAADASPEALAQALAAHPDYKVLRRLQPRVDWGPLSGQATQRVLVLDTETTGLDARQESVIELALLSVQIDSASGLPVGPVEVYESFEDPGKPIPPAITEITGIDDAMVRGQRADDARVAHLVQAADLVVAHNAAFDRPFVEARWPVFADKAWNCSFAGIDWKQEGSGSAKLEFLAHERGWFYDAHRALVDCHALLQVLAAPLKSGATGWQRLLEGAQQPRYKLRANGAPFESKDALKARGYRWDSEQRVWWIGLAGEPALQAETAWLKANVYPLREARLQLEVQGPQVRFSSRPGTLSELRL